MRKRCRGKQPLASAPPGLRERTWWSRYDYERLLFKGCLLLQLHAWEVDADEHLQMGSPDLKPYGNGVLLWFQMESFDAAVARARELHTEILEEPYLNPNAHHRECWIGDPDGYMMVLASVERDWKRGT